jgi:hypothetical protein
MNCRHETVNGGGVEGPSTWGSVALGGMRGSVIPKRMKRHTGPVYIRAFYVDEVTPEARTRDEGGEGGIEAVFIAHVMTRMTSRPWWSSGSNYVKSHLARL